MTFEELDLDRRLLRATQDAGFSVCTPVQEQTFVYSLIGADVAVQSQTGTGKTAAFLITIFQLFIEQSSLNSKMALIVAPTRELADQIEKDAIQLGRYLDFPIASFYGGVGYKKQETALASGVRLVIGTPGRLLDFAKQRKLDLNQVGILVIDEADRLFDMGFIPDLRRLINQMPSREKRITMLYSATLSSRVKSLAWEYMRNPAEITIKPEKMTVEEITQELYHVSRDRKLSLLLGILARNNPKTALIFTNTKQSAYELATRMRHNGFDCEYIVGDLPQSKRQRLIDDLKSGALRFLAATDVAARGLHVDGLDMVINYDLPEHSENYVHRIGRTARAGRSGKAVTLACEEFVFALEGIEELLRTRIPVVFASEDMYLEDDSINIRVGHYLKRREKNIQQTHGNDRSVAVTSSTRNFTKTSKPVGTSEKNREQRSPRFHDSRKVKITDANKGPRRDTVNLSGQNYEGSSANDRPSESKSRGQLKKSGRVRNTKERVSHYEKKYGERFKVVRDDVHSQSRTGDKIIGKVDKNRFRSLLRKLFNGSSATDRKDSKRKK